MPIYRSNSPVYNSFPFERLYAIGNGDTYNIMYMLINGTLTDFITDLKQNTEDYIVGVTYYPFNMSYFGNFDTKRLSLGKETWSSIGVKEFRMKPDVHLGTIYKKPRKHNNFLDFAPYTKITLQVPFFEKFDIDPRDLYEHTIEIYMSVDFAQNQATCYLYRDGLFMIDSRTAVIGIDIPLGKTNEAEQKRNNVLQTISAIGSIAAMAVGVASGNTLITGAGVGLLTKNITTGLANNVDRLTGYKGSNGGRNFLSVDREIILMIEEPQNISYPDVDLKGKVLNKTKTLNTLRGYTECDNIHFNPFSTEITDGEIEEIVDHLKNGVEL